MRRDTWRPTAGREVLGARARMLGCIRGFFAEAGVMEVETPVASRAATTDPVLHSLRTGWLGGGAQPQALYLQTSPELPMKRLLVAGSGPIYQICKVFRDGERGRLHHPEFSLLEWYRPGMGYRALMAEVADLVRLVLDRRDLALEALSYQELFQTHLGLDPLRADVQTLRSAAADIPGATDLSLDVDGWLDLLLSHLIEPTLGKGRMTFVYDYPASQAALARIRAGTASVAERFELYLEGMELANGFQELTDAAEQRRRFAADLEVRIAAGLDVPPLDQEFLAALEAGMPDTSGVALGLDRLLMIAIGSSHLEEVLAFPIERA